MRMRRSFARSKVARGLRLTLCRTKRAFAESLRLSAGVCVCACACARTCTVFAVGVWREVG